MRYWDASALLALVVEEQGTALARGWLEEDGEVCTWAWTQVELSSAIERRAREGRLPTAMRQRLLREVALLGSHLVEVTDLLAVRSRALPLLARYPLRAADAAQLAAALVVADPDPTSLTFVCLDRRLTDAASREGMPVLGWPS